MLHYYAVKNLMAYLAANPQAGLASMCADLAGPRQREWFNLGGQLVSAADMARLIGEIKASKYKNWHEIHAAYDRLWAAYPREKQRHALGTLLELLAVEKLTPQLWSAALSETLRIQEFIRDQVYLSRKKDYDNPFRRATYRNEEEMKAVIGTAEDNSFVKQTRKDAEAFKMLVAEISARG